MKYYRPDYIEYLPECVKPYFDEKIFDDRPYPPTEEAANEYLLYDVFKVKKSKKITLKDGDKKLVFEKGHYFEAFKYNNWSRLSLSSKFTLLYWFFVDTAKELKVYPPKIDIITCPDNVAGYFMSSENILALNILQDIDEKQSAYDFINTIAHELNHAQFYAKDQKEDALHEKNANYYFNFPDQSEYDTQTFRGVFDYNYAVALYYAQPVESSAYNYANEKVTAIFEENNIRTNKAGKKVYKKGTSDIDIFCFKTMYADMENNKQRIKNILGEDFENTIDLEIGLIDIQNEICELSCVQNVIEDNIEATVATIRDEIDIPIDMKELYAENLKELNMANKQKAKLEKEITKRKNKLFNARKDTLLTYELPKLKIITDHDIHPQKEEAED